MHMYNSWSTAPSVHRAHVVQSGIKLKQQSLCQGNCAVVPCLSLVFFLFVANLVR